jgi:hypothetical protein
VVLLALDVDWRRLIFEAAYSKGLHEWMVKVLWLLPSIRGGWNDTLNVSLTKEVDKFLVGTIGQKSWLSWEILVDAIKTEANPSKCEMSLSVTIRTARRRQ